MSGNDEIFTPGGGFGRYQIERKLGEGGMCVVWHARHKGLGKPVAIKVLKPDHARNPLTRGRFQREGEAIARIHHANVVEVHDVGIVDGAPYLVMEYLEGEDLRAFFERRGPLSLAELSDVMVPVCSAVAAAHDEGIVHRDLKPENIFLAHTRDRGVVPKVLDFGISRINDADGRNDTGTHAFMGTPRYMSPEQTQGAKNIDARSDQYSLGVILYQGATGRLPIDETVLFRLLQRIVAGQFAPPRAIRPDLPNDFEAIILRAMATAPEGRFATVRELAATLLPYASERVRVLHSDSLVDGQTLPRSWAPSLPPPMIAQTAPIVSATAPLTAPIEWGAPPSAVPPPLWDTTLGASAREVPTNPLPRKSGRDRRVLTVVALVGAIALTSLAVGVLYPWADERPSHPRSLASSVSRPTAPSRPQPPNAHATASRHVDTAAAPVAAPPPSAVQIIPSPAPPPPTAQAAAPTSATPAREERATHPTNTASRERVPRRTAPAAPPRRATRGGDSNWNASVPTFDAPSRRAPVITTRSGHAIE